MAELQVVSALRNKRSELAGIVSRLEQQLLAHRASLTHVDATMRLFDPDSRPEEIRPRQQRARNSWFRLGECLRLIYDVLRDTPEPVTTRELAERIMRVKAISCLLAVADPAEVLAPGGLLGVARQIRPGDMMVMAEFAPAQAREIGLGAIGAGAGDTVAVLVVDPPHGELGVQRVSGRALVTPTQDVSSQKFTVAVKQGYGPAGEQGSSKLARSGVLARSLPSRAARRMWPARRCGRRTHGWPTADMQP